MNQEKFTISTSVVWDETLQQDDCKMQQLYIIGLEPFIQKGYQLKHFKNITHTIVPGQYRISLQYFSKEHTLEVIVSSNNTECRDILTYGKFLYFEVTKEGTIIPGNKELFDAKFRIRSQNINKEKIAFWNTYWILLHTATFYYPTQPQPEHKEDIVKLVRFMNNRGIPCQLCAKHFKEWSTTYPIDDYTESREKMFKYFVDLHNDVNTRQRKKLVTIEEAEIMYKSSNDNLITNYDINMKELVEKHKIHTIPSIVNGKVRRINKKKYNLL